MSFAWWQHEGGRDYRTLRWLIDQNGVLCAGPGYPGQGDNFNFREWRATASGGVWVWRSSDPDVRWREISEAEAARMYPGAVSSFIRWSPDERREADAAIERYEFRWSLFLSGKGAS